MIFLHWRTETVQNGTIYVIVIKINVYSRENNNNGPYNRSRSCSTNYRCELAPGLLHWSVRLHGHSLCTRWSYFIRHVKSDRNTEVALSGFSFHVSTVFVTRRHTKQTHSKNPFSLKWCRGSVSSPRCVLTRKQIISPE